MSPFWLSEPKDVTVLLGQPIAVPCQADGYPTPNVTWFRNAGKCPNSIPQPLNIAFETVEHAAYEVISI